MSLSPFLSVVIPTYERPRELAACLAALSRTTYPRDRFEVIVVDDGGSTPATASPQLGMTVRVVRQPNSGPARARNLGASQATGSLIVFTDDDCAPHADWLGSLAAAHLRAPQAVVGGRTENGLPGNVFSTASQVLIDFLYHWYNRDPDRATFFTTNNLAVPRAVLRETGGFDASFPRAAGEDREFCDRLVDTGHALHYAPAAVVDHAHRLTLRRFWIQHQNYGRAAYHFHKLRAARRQKPPRVEPPRFYAELLTFPFRSMGPIEGLAVAALIALSQVANAAGFFRQRAEGIPTPQDTSPKPEPVAAPIDA